MKPLVLALVFLASCYGLLFSAEPSKTDYFSLPHESRTPLFDIGSCFFIPYTRICTCGLFWWNVWGRHFIWKVQYSEFSKEMCGSGIIGSCCGNLTFKMAEGYSAVLGLDSGMPFAPCFHEANSFEAGRFSSACIGALWRCVASILSNRACSKIRTSVIKSVVIDMINMRIMGTKTKNETMHADTLAFFAFPVSMYGISVAQMPRGKLHDKIEILIINKSIGVRNRDSFHLHSPESKTVPHGEPCLLPRQNTEPTRDGFITGHSSSESMFCLGNHKYSTICLGCQSVFAMNARGAFSWA